MDSSQSGPYIYPGEGPDPEGYRQPGDMISLFDYFDYRAFLKDHFVHQKALKKFYSYRYISRNTGIDASYYVRVLNKKAHLSDGVLDRFAGFLKLNKREKDYFIILVQFNKSRHQDQITKYLEKLITLRDPIAKVIDARKYQFFNKWYHIAVRELLNFFPFSGDFKELGSKLCPPISEAESKSAIQLLSDLKMIRRKKNREYELTEHFMTTGEAWHGIAIRNFQKEILKLGGEALERFPKERRDISTVTVNISWKCFGAMTERLKEMRKELLEMAKADASPQEVFQINFQVFPLTRASAVEGNP